ncbi:unnamed protein product, partial [Allacma fusca]
TTAYGFYIPDCYKGVVERDMTCLVSGRIVDLIGLKFLTDIYGQKMFKYSEDSLDPGPLGIGVSKYFPQLAVELSDLLDWIKENRKMFIVTDHLQ